MNEKPDFDTICMSGGGIKGISFLGALDYLEFNSYIDTSKIINWVGTSVGSILSFLFTLGYTVHEIGDFTIDFNFTKIQPEPSIDNLIESFGIDDGSKLNLIMIGFLKEKYNVDVSMILKNQEIIYSFFDESNKDKLIKELFNSMDDIVISGMEDEDLPRIKLI
jgi:predicted acylesterase/phospholipase RssA